MTGRDYVAVTTLTTRDGVVARAGERCDFVPVESVPWLLRAGAIAPISDAEKAKAPKKPKGSV